MQILGQNQAFKQLDLQSGEIINYLEEGREDSPYALVCIPEFSSNCMVFKQLLSNLSDEYRVISVDLRGHGLSTLKHKYKSLDCFTDDMTELLELLNVRVVALLGLGFGAVIASHIAKQIPITVDKMIAINSPSDCIDSHLHEHRAFNRGDFYQIKHLFGSEKKDQLCYELLREMQFVNPEDSDWFSSWHLPRKELEEPECQTILINFDRSKEGQIQTFERESHKPLGIRKNALAVSKMGQLISTIKVFLDQE